MVASQTQHGEPRRLVMSAPTPLRQDFDASELRGLARKTNLSSSNHLPPISGSNVLTPVMLPPGTASLWTYHDPPPAIPAQQRLYEPELLDRFRHTPSARRSAACARPAARAPRAATPPPRRAAR